MPVDDQISNPTSNRPFADVLATRMSRRSMMAGSLATAAVAFFGQSGIAQAAKGGQTGPNVPGPNQPGLLGFSALFDSTGPVPKISDDYEYAVLIPWGTPLFAGVADLGDPTDHAAFADRPDQRVGIGHDGMWFFPINGSSDHGVLCINHEFGSNEHVLGYDAPAVTADDAAVSRAVHGVAVVEIEKTGGSWVPVVPSRYNRRITTDNTAVVFDGPAAGHPLLESALGNPAAGTVNNCGNGYTPWGTYLTCEENFNGYFGWTDGSFVPTESQERYGFSPVGFGYGWHLHDERWDLGKNANEEHRFGWIVEIDPMNPSAPPIKHTALGRVKHEGFAFATGRGGRAVGYMGDDQANDYIYKFVSSSNWKSMRARGINPLSDGKLYVARFNEDGTGDWLELTIENPALAAKFANQGELLIHTRLAADILGATPMDRPEWTSVAPNGDVYCTLTNNSGRTVADAANPLAPNPDGHIIRWRDADNHVGTTFEWDIFVISATTQPGSTNPDNGYAFSDPDGLWCDPDGRVFIETDGGQPRVQINGQSGVRLNNQLLVADPFTGEIRRLFAGVTGDEITGIAITPDRRTLFVNTQHPGDGIPAASNFPVLNDPAQPDGPIPRDSTIVITRRDGGIVGS